MNRDLGHYTLHTDQKYRTSSGSNLGGPRTSLPSSHEPTKRGQSSPTKIPHHTSKGSASQHPDNPKDPVCHGDPETKQGVKSDVLSPKTMSQLTVHGFQSRNISPAVEDATLSQLRRLGRKADAPTEPRPVDSETGRRISVSKERLRPSRGALDRPPQSGAASGVRSSADGGEEGAKCLGEASAPVDPDDAELRQRSRGVELGLSKSSGYESARKKPVAARRWISPADNKDSGKDAENKREPKANNEQSEN